MRRGEQVPPEEIEAAVRAAEAREAGAATTDGTNDDDATEPESPTPKRRVTRSSMKNKKPIPPSKHVAPKEEPNPDVNEWIPETHLNKPNTRRKSGR